MPDKSFKELRAEAKDILIAKAELALKPDQAAARAALLRKGWSAARADKAIASARKIMGLDGSLSGPARTPDAIKREAAPLNKALERLQEQWRETFWRQDLKPGELDRLKVEYERKTDEIEAKLIKLDHEWHVAKRKKPLKGLGASDGLKCVKVKAPLVSFDKRSIRTITRGTTRILIGCPEGQWMSKAKRCKVGTRAYETITPGACPRGSGGKTKRG